MSTALDHAHHAGVPATLRASITWIQHRAVCAGDIERCRTAPLAGALQRQFKSDAHFQASTSPLGCRLSSKHLGATAICMTVLCFDLDGPGHQASPEWRADTAAKIARLRAEQPEVLDYETRGGHRVLWPLAEPFELRDRDSCREWTARYLRECDRLERDFGLIADRACKDPWRLFRLPGATRPPEPEQGSEQGHSPGGNDVVAILASLVATTRGVIPASKRDCGASSQDTESAINHSPPASVSAPAAEPLPSGRLIQLLESNGMIRGQDPCEPRRWHIECPNASEHTSNADGAYLLADGSRDDGIIKCFHSHCEAIGYGQWLQLMGVDSVRGVQIVDFYTDNESRHGRPRIGFRLAPVDCRGDLSCILRVSADQPRWAQLWRILGISVPADDDTSLDGDLYAACYESLGKRFAVELDSDGRVEKLLSWERKA